MRLTIVALAFLSLAGCVRSIEDVKSLPPLETATTARSPAEVRDCLVPIISGGLARPIETGTPDDRSLTFSSASAGAFLHYRIQSEGEGSRVTVQRRKVAGDNYDRGRSCYTD